MHLNAPPVVVNKLREELRQDNPLEPQASLVGWMKLTRVYLRAHDHSVSTIMFEILDLDSRISFQRSRTLLRRQVML